VTVSYYSDAFEQTAQEKKLGYGFVLAGSLTRSPIVGSGTILMEVTLPGTLADTNPSRELARISQSVAGAPYRVIAPVTAHIEKLNVQLPENVIVIGWPPAHKINPMADISVIHGGIGTVMTAALAGKPVVGVGMQPGQDANLDCLVRKGFAIRIPKGTANARKILAAVDKLCHDDEAKRKAQEFATIVAQRDGPRRVSEFLDGEFA